MAIPFDWRLPRMLRAPTGLLMLALLATTTPSAAAVDTIHGNGFEQMTQVEEIQLDPLLQGQNLRVGPVIVTAVRPSANNATFFVQVPRALSSNPTYPRHAGLKVFNSTVIAGLLAGDCVSFNGTVTEFQGATELTQITNLLVEPGASCGAIAISPQLVAVGDVATDTDSIQAGDQPGPLAEALEGVLIRVGPVTATQGAIAGAFPVSDGNSTSILVIGSLLFQYNAVFNEPFSTITGVVDQQQANPGLFVYRLLPRGAADLVP